MDQDALARFSRRAFPDPVSLAAFDARALPAEALAAARLVWHRRVVNEHGSVVVAQRLIDVLGSIDEVPGAVFAAAGRLHLDEEAHEKSAREMVLHLGGHIEPALPEPAAPEGTPVERLVQLVLTGLAICETVSAARYARVRTWTDLPVPRACIDLFLRDEVQHGKLGFLLLPWSLGLLRKHRVDAEGWLTSEMTHTFSHLRGVLAPGVRSVDELPEERPQPSPNPGVVEPLVDAHAFFRVIADEIVPQLEQLGLGVRMAWARAVQSRSAS